MSSEKQTLILAGEMVPRRGSAFATSSFRAPLTVIATPVDEPLLIAQGDSEIPSPEPAALAAKLVASHRSANIGASYGAADAYARTQQLAAPYLRVSIIDTYA